MDCWEIKKCGREAGGAKAGELGVCPAFTKGAGKACWLVAGTFCGGEVQGTYADKEKNCMQCDVYKNFDLKHRSEMRLQFSE